MLVASPRTSQGDDTVLWIVVAVVFVLWIIGFAVFHVTGTLLPLVLVFAIVTLIVRFLTDQRTVR
jgi:Family of unknown function (DUF5670)